MFLFEVIKLLTIILSFQKVATITMSCVQTFNRSKETLLNCSSLHSTIIPNNMSTSIMHMILSHNRIKKITYGSFARYTILVYLDISNNLLDKLGVDSFNGLNRLEILNIS